MKYIQRFLLTMIMAIAVLGAKADWSEWLDNYGLNVGDTKELYVSDMTWATLNYSTTHWISTTWTTSNSSVVKITYRGKSQCTIEAIGNGEAKIEYNVHWGDAYLNWFDSKGYYNIYVEGEKITITANPNGGTVPQGAKVTLSSSPSDASIYYTLDGTTPTYKSNAYTSSGITINNDCTLKAIAVKKGYTDSNVLTAQYTVEPPEGSKITISASPNGGTVTKGTKVTLSSSPSSANIYYTLDGSTPTSSSTVYSSSGILLYDDCTLKAIAMKSGYVNSDVLTAQYLVEPAEGSKITISASPNGGNIPIGEKVTLSTSPRDAKIYYTLDGSTPTSSSKVYTSSGIAINNDCTLKAIAMKSGYTNSDVLTAKYTVVIADYTVEGVLLTYKVTDVNAKTVEVSGIESGTSGSVTIPSEVKGYKVTGIGYRAFNHCSKLTSVNIPKSVTSIGEYAFSWCSDLFSLNIPESVTSIGRNAFVGCSYLSYITIPESVTSIGSSAFEYCRSLTSITMYGIPDTVETDAFPTTATIYVPAAIYDAAVVKFPDNVIRTLEEVANCYVMLTLADGTTQTDIFVDGVIHIEKYYGREDIVSAEINEGITSIGNSAFEGCTSLTSITIPESVTSIGYSAFEGCTSLTSITIPESVTSIGGAAFEGCKSLASITIPESITSISYSAFEGCTSLTSITIPGSVTSIGFSAFKGCTSLASISIPGSVTSIGRSAFYNCTSLTSVIIPESVTTIEDNTFSDCTSLTSIAIPESVTSIGSSAFSRCTSLTSITIPGAVTSIGYWAFKGCTSLISITIPESVTSIDFEAFWDCTSLTSITIPESVTSIDNGAFEYCTSLTSITMYGIPESVGTDAFPTTATIYVPAAIYDDAVWKFPLNKIRTLEEVVASRYVMLTLADGSTQTDIFVDKVITSKKYYGREDILCAEIGEEITSIGDSAFEGCTSLTSITIPESVTTIGNSVFEGCTSLTSITIPESVTSIDYWTFSGCTSLTSITIPESVTSIGFCAFEGCTSLISITIPESVTSIGFSAFKGCTSLISITIPGAVTYIGFSAFEGCTSLTSVTMYGIPEVVGIDAIPTSATIYVPAAIYDAAVAKFPNNVIMTLEEVAGYYVKLMLADGTTQTDIFEDGVIPNKKYDRREDIVSAEIGDGIISIGDDTFFRCSGLTSVTIGNSVASIGKSAFYDCSSLTSVVIPNSVIEMGGSAFDSCELLKDVYISTSIKRLESYTFWGANIEKFTGGDNIEYIDSGGIYRHCPWEENLPDGMNFIGKVLFKYQGEVPANTTINIPAGCAQIYSSDAFADKDGLVGINIPASVTDIAEGAFKNCPNLQMITVDASNPVYDSRNNCNAVIEKATNTLTHGCSSSTIPTNVTSIGDLAFYGNWTKDEIIIPNQIVSIANYAFRNNSNVKSILIGKGLRKLGWYVFAQLPHLKEISVSTSNPYFDSRDNCNAIIEKATNTLVVGCSSTIIPNTVKIIEDGAFNGNGDEDFTSLVIPNSIEEIGYVAFARLPYLRKVSIGANVKEFDNRIFSECISLEAIETLNESPDDIREDVFDSGSEDFSIYDNVTLYVPEGSRNEYRLATGWSNFKNIVEGSLPVGIDDVLTPQQKEEVIYSPTGVRLSAPQRGVNIVNGKKLLVK